MYTASASKLNKFYNNTYFPSYRPQTKFAKVMFLHVSVCPQEGVSRPRPRVEVGGSDLGWDCLGP